MVDNIEEQIIKRIHNNRTLSPIISMHKFTKKIQKKGHKLNCDLMFKTKLVRNHCDEFAISWF